MFHFFLIEIVFLHLTFAGQYNKKQGPKKVFFSAIAEVHTCKQRVAAKRLQELSSNEITISKLNVIQLEIQHFSSYIQYGRGKTPTRLLMQSCLPFTSCLDDAT